MVGNKSGKAWCFLDTKIASWSLIGFEIARGFVSGSVSRFCCKPASVFWLSVDSLKIDAHFAESRDMTKCSLAPLIYRSGPMTWTATPCACTKPCVEGTGTRRLRGSFQASFTKDKRDVLLMDIPSGYSTIFNIAMENGPFTDDFPIKTTIYRGFSMAMWVITRGYLHMQKQPSTECIVEWCWMMLNVMSASDPTTYK